MPKSLNKFKQKIKSLQRADEKSKKIWLIGATAISMIFVVSFWIFYLNMTLPKTTASTEKTGGQTKEKPWNTFSLGFKTLSKEFSEKLDEIKSGVGEQFNSVKEGIEKTNDFSLETESPISYPEINEEIPDAPLP